MHISQQTVASKNWLATVPGKGWFVILRMYSPLEPWFDRIWMPGDPVLVK